MAFLPRRQLDELVKFAAIADKEIRSDLARGYIVNENDYTSNFTGNLRRIINSNSRHGLTATSFVLPGGTERAFGTDAAIVLNYGNEIKVAIFEGKWPRFETVGYPWDYSQKSNGVSHFSDQITRQAKWAGQFAVFEMVYCEYDFGKQPAFMENEGSSCIWHDDADSFRRTLKPSGKVWSQNDLGDLLDMAGRSLRSVVKDFGLCKQGQVLVRMDLEILANQFRLPENILSITAQPNEVRRNIRQ